MNKISQINKDLICASKDIYLEEDLLLKNPNGKNHTDKLNLAELDYQMDRYFFKLGVPHG
jgi:hypothetical protein